MDLGTCETGRLPKFQPVWISISGMATDYAEVIHVRIGHFAWDSTNLYCLIKVHNILLQVQAKFNIKIRFNQLFVLASPS